MRFLKTLGLTCVACERFSFGDLCGRHIALVALFDNDPDLIRRAARYLEEGGTTGHSASIDEKENP